MIYLDYSATTPLLCDVKEAVNEAMDTFGNPSSLYSLGLDAEHLISDARSNILTALGLRNAKKEQLIFTGSGSEANNTALFGVAHAKPSNKGKRIVTTKSEHPSIIESANALAREGYDVVFLSCKNGVISSDEIKDAITKDTILCSVMYVNNETGAVNDVKSIFDYARSVNPDIVCHTDCVQAFGKIPVSPKSLGADLISISAHKIGAPKGVGALYISPEVIKAKRISRFIQGGEQESGMRAGTENTLGIVGFGKAATHDIKDINVANEIRKKLICAIGQDVKYNEPQGKFLPYIISVTLPQIKSETMLHYLSAEGIFVSAGSACSAHSPKPSHVLLDFGLSPKEAGCTLRISFNTDLTDEQISKVGNSFKEGLAKLARIR